MWYHLIELTGLKIPHKRLYRRVFDLYTSLPIDYVDAYHAALIESRDPPELYSYDLRLPILRAERRLSQRQLAALAGVRPDTISALERGESTGIRFDTLARLCEVLECDPGDLFEVEEDFHRVPVLGGPDEDDLARQRLRERR